MTTPVNIFCRVNGNCYRIDGDLKKPTEEYVRRYATNQIKHKVAVTAEIAMMGLSVGLAGRGAWLGIKGEEQSPALSFITVPLLFGAVLARSRALDYKIQMTRAVSSLQDILKFVEPTVPTPDAMIIDLV